MQTPSTLRTIVVGGAVLAAALVLAPAALGQGQPTAPPPTWTTSQGELQTPDRNNTASVPNAVEAPLHDLNITRQPIPPVLLAAITNPYAPVTPRTCPAIERQVEVLQAALGADLDEPETPQSPSLTLHNGKVALALLHGAAESLLPFAGFVRTLTGAGHHDELVVEAITAGSVRRGYLKGMGEVMHCPPPGRPIHFIHPPPPAVEDFRGPKYPIK
jgi:hypothetical protein